MLKMYVSAEILLFVVFLIISTGYCVSSQNGYYKIEDGNSLQASQQDIHLEDFFWTGSGDGPSPFVKKASDFGGIFGKETIIKTATILATVYISGEDENTDSLCVYDCDGTIDQVETYLPSDRRYWLLTVVAGFFGRDDLPIVEEKLAKLYRIAFTRQQANHLGITNNTIDDVVKTRKKRSFISPTKTIRKIEEFKKSFESKFKFRRNVVGVETEIVFNSTVNSTKENLNNFFVNEFSGNTKKGRQKVNVLIHNVTALSEEDLRGTDIRVDNNSNVNKSTKLSNQTEIIYTVFVGGKPVLATTAAKDMQLITQDEVAHVMENIVYTKAEPYLKEPQATPLIPATNGNSNLVGVLSENPIAIIVSCSAFSLIVILLIGLLLMTRSKRKRSADVKRLTATQALVSQHTTNVVDTNSIIPHDDRGEMVCEGVDNLGYEREQQRFDGTNRIKTNIRSDISPVLHFPLPPHNRPPSSSSSSTSDLSSLYYHKSHLDIQDILDEKAANLFHKKQKKNGEIDEQVYATVLKKKDRKRDRNKLRTLRKKYMSENRVGSIEEVQIHSPISGDSDMFETSTKLTPNFEHNEAFNPNVGGVHYHKNKLLQDHRFIVTRNDEYEIDTLGLESPNEAINNELLKALRKNDRSSADTGSIGSFLSMASVKSFPRCSVPEPLSRVLEPVSVTHLDHYDADLDTGKTLGTTNRDSFHFKRSQSDGNDPGVIGPVVWELHKKEMENKDNSSPLRDPLITRNRFEGLLEGAIKMYSTNDNPNSKDDEVLGAIKSKDFRGKSAIVLRNTENMSRPEFDGPNRPMTAGQITIGSTTTQPPSPSRRAWGSGAPSPMVRPMSAGPFHRPDPLTIEIRKASQSVDRPNVSAAPLIEAIQTELRKFNKNKS